MCERERHPFGFMRTRLAGALMLTQLACSGGGVTSPAPVPAPPSDPPTVAGVWRGSNARLSLVWLLEQRGASITGSASIAGAGGWTSTDGSVTGTISGYTLFFEETHPLGTLSLPGCSAQVRGALQISSVAPPRQPRAGDAPNRTAPR